MTKSLIIEFDPQDESLLIAFFKKLSIKTKNLEVIDSKDLPENDLEEHVFVQKALQNRYVTTGQWEKMTDEEHQDAALAEMMNYEQQRPDYKVMTAEESETFYNQLKKQLYANTSD